MKELPQVNARPIKITQLRTDFPDTVQRYVGWGFKVLSSGQEADYVY